MHGTARGTYDLSIRGYDSRLEPSGQEFSDVAIDAGVVHSYTIYFFRVSSVRVER